MLVLVLILSCHSVIHITFLKPLYVPNILLQTSVVWEYLDNIFVFYEKENVVCYAFILFYFLRKQKNITGFQIATVVAINPCACIGVENGLQDTKYCQPKSIIAWFCAHYKGIQLCSHKGKDLHAQQGAWVHTHTHTHTHARTHAFITHSGLSDPNFNRGLQFLVILKIITKKYQFFIEPISDVHLSKGGPPYTAVELFLYKFADLKSFWVFKSFFLLKIDSFILMSSIYIHICVL